MTVEKIRVPEALRLIPDPPSALWLHGQIPTRKGVAIVGTRRCTSYGRRLARLLGAAVGRCGWPVISGLARGIDAAAHYGVTEVKGIGVAVLGSGVDVVYPRENADLADRLVNYGGGILSEYPPGTPPAPFRFPARNRLIAGLSDAVVVVEAAVTGGALITARMALDQGKEVLAVPGDIDRPTSAGCNLLIRDGAHPVLGVDDLLETLGIMMGPPPNPGVKVAEPSLPVTIDELIEGSARPVSAVLADLTRAEISGELTIDSGQVGSSGVEGL
ncbi:MAG TPA: DNA-processing protein DprA [Acidimicrobiia bacterium]|nr:DNA-processing protein DprA [Acidimicrobiia bacterium]